MTTATPTASGAPASPAIDRAKAACVAYLPVIERATPGDGGALRVPFEGTYVRVTCYRRASDGVLVVRVSKPHHVRHYHIVESETTP